MPPDDAAKFALPYLMALVAADVICRIAAQMIALEGIEQATYDREFWELVHDGAG